MGIVGPTKGKKEPISRKGVPQPKRKKLATPELPLDAEQCRQFGTALMAWYRVHRRELPWRGVEDPYRIWVSEIMLQQTRVEATLDHYRRFIARFPTMLALALAPEDEVLALWSGLGYYRRARMLYNAAKFVVRELGGVLPHTSAELRRLPGVGPYTAAAIASIAFGQPVAVVDGNVQRVLLRIAGLPEARGIEVEFFNNTFAQALLPPETAGDHNQAMMELGATVCLPRGPLCMQCPVLDFCRTRGEHVTLPRAAMRSKRVSYALCTKQDENGEAVEVMLHRRAAAESLMPGMLELPTLSAPPVETEPRLVLRHSIVGVNYYVEVFAVDGSSDVLQIPGQEGRAWFPVSGLGSLPLTGVARKVLLRTGMMQPGVGDSGAPASGPLAGDADPSVDAEAEDISL